MKRFFTKQSELLRFGERWGCYFCALINIVEAFRGSAFTVREIWTAVGACQLNETFHNANYKKHTDLDKEPKGWGPADDPEWHFLIRSQADTLRFIALAVGIQDEIQGDYLIEEWKTKYGTHFVARINGDVVNPDESIECLKVIGNRAV